MTAKAAIRAARDGKCVTGFHCAGALVSRKHMPAAFLVAMPFRLVMDVLPRCKIYKPQPKPQPKSKL